MELWKSGCSEFAESWIFGSRFERALSFTVTDSGCCNCKNFFFLRFFIFMINSFLCNCVTRKLVYDAQIGKMLKPEKWQASFDSDGRVSGFPKALKLIILGVCFPLAE